MRYHNDEPNIAMTDAERERAKQFRDRFGGELIDPATRPRWPDPHTTRNHLSAEERLRNGRCVNCDD